MYILSSHTLPRFHRLWLTQRDIAGLLFWSSRALSVEPNRRLTLYCSSLTRSKIRLLPQKLPTVVSRHCPLCCAGTAWLSAAVWSHWGGTRRWVKQQPQAESPRPPFGSSLQLEWVPEGNHTRQTNPDLSLLYRRKLSSLRGLLPPLLLLLLRAGELTAFENRTSAEFRPSCTHQKCCWNMWEYSALEGRGCIFSRLWQSTLQLFIKALWLSWKAAHSNI